LAADKHGTDMAWRKDHTESLFYKEKVYAVVHIALAVNSFAGSVDCYGNITAEFDK
jgi:hypothetical protein